MTSRDPQRYCEAVWVGYPSDSLASCYTTEPQPHLNNNYPKQLRLLERGNKRSRETV